MGRTKSVRFLFSVSGIPRVHDKEGIVFCTDEEGSAVAYLVAHNPIPAVTTRYLNHEVRRATRLFCITRSSHVVAMVAVKIAHFGIGYVSMLHRESPFVVGYDSNIAYWVSVGEDKKCPFIEFCKFDLLLSRLHIVLLSLGWALGQGYRGDEVPKTIHFQEGETAYQSGYHA